VFGEWFESRWGHRLTFLNILCDFTQSLQTYAEIVPQIRSLELPSILFPIPYSITHTDLHVTALKDKFPVRTKLITDNTLE
jgi:hypothetical protein